MKSTEIFVESLRIRDSLKEAYDFHANPIDISLLPILPFCISHEIKLIIIGQDPTVKNSKSRQSIEYTLNLDKNGSLKKYICDITGKLGMRFENIYATNIFKYFYSEPPERTKGMLSSHLEPNLKLLKEEISAYPRVPIITLGFPVLRLLTEEDAEVHKYWNYEKKTMRSGQRFNFCRASDNKLERDFFPFPHQPSLVKIFYKDTLNEYLKYMKHII
jgi:hypothetical protein